MNENEVATKRTIMVNIDGFLVPKKIPLRRHNKNKPKTTKTIEGRMDTFKQKNEDFDFDAHNSMVKSAKPASALGAKTSFRLLRKDGKGTVSKHPTYAAAVAAHKVHPDKHKLFVENTDMHGLVRTIMESKKDKSVVESKSTLKFSEYRAIYEEQEEILEAKIEEKKQLLLGAKKKTVNDIELDENAFNWKSPDVKRPVWNDPEDAPKAKAVKVVDPDAPKRGRGRPAGSYGKYKVGGRSEADKQAIGSKVHSNPERKAKYDDAIAARKEFKSLMNKAISAKEKTPK